MSPKCIYLRWSAEKNTCCACVFLGLKSLLHVANKLDETQPVATVFEKTPSLVLVGASLKTRV